MRTPRRQRAEQAAGWAARVAMLFGGVTLAMRFGLPAAAPAAAVAEPFGERTGHGNPAEPPSRQARLARHETSDMSGRLMLRLVAGLGIVMALAIVGMVGAQRIMRSRADHAQPPLTAEQLVQPPPPAPNLQANPVPELAALHARESRLLDAYAWITPDHARARIPINRAMTLIIGRKLDAAP